MIDATDDPLTEPQRIAFIGDVHENGPWTVKAINRARQHNADVIVQLGDFGYSYSRGFLDAVSDASRRGGMPFLFVDGNHENHPKLNRFPVGQVGLRQVAGNVWHLPRGFRWEWAGIRFLALGGAHSVDRPWRRPGVEWWPEETITDEQAAEVIEGGTADVLVSHDVPTGVIVPGIDDASTPAPFPPPEILRANEHRQLLRRVVDAARPRQIWHGHYHVAYDTTAELGYGPVQVTGLDCDETRLDDNVHAVDLADLQAAS